MLLNTHTQSHTHTHTYIYTTSEAFAHTTTLRDPLEEHFGKVLALGLINVDEDAKERFGENTLNSFLFVFSPVHAFRVTSDNSLEGLIE